MKKNMKTVLFVIIAFGVLILCILGIFLISNKHYHFKLADIYSFKKKKKNYKLMMLYIAIFQIFK